MTLRLSPDAIVAESSSTLLTIAPWWERCRLGDVAEITNGAAFKSAQFNTQGHGLPLIRIRDVGQVQASTHYSGDYETRHLVESGDLLVGMDGDFRIARWDGTQSLLNQRVCRIRVRAHDHYSDRFLEYVVQPYLDEIHKVTSAVTVKHLSSRTVNDLPIPLPPRSEQERLVAAIEEHFSRLDAAETLVDASIHRLPRLLETAIRIELQKCSATSVPLHRVLSEGLSNGKSVRTAESGGFPVLRLTCLRNGSVDANETKKGDFGDMDPARFKVEPDDFLISRGNGSLHLVGLGGLVPADVPAVAYPDTLIRARVDRSRLRPKFLSLVWNSQVVRRQLESQARTTAGIYKVNQQMIERVALPIPSPDAQDEVVRNVDALQPSVEALRHEVTRTQRRMAELRRSVLAAAFSGRLVPQDPDDEPASVLLERITAAKPQQPTRRRTRT